MLCSHRCFVSRQKCVCVCVGRNLKLKTFSASGYAFISFSLWTVCARVNTSEYWPPKKTLSNKVLLVSLVQVGMQSPMKPRWFEPCVLVCFCSEVVCNTFLDQGMFHHLFPSKNQGSRNSITGSKLWRLLQTFGILLLQTLSLHKEMAWKHKNRARLHTSYISCRATRSIWIWMQEPKDTKGAWARTPRCSRGMANTDVVRYYLIDITWYYYLILHDVMAVG